MKKPCANCPFLKKVTYVFTKNRVNEIVKHLVNDSSFICHKTIDYPTSALCFGSALFLEKINAEKGGCFSNLVYRLGCRAGEFNQNDLRQDETIYDSVEQLLDNSF